jgi:hypothetical protein
MYTNQNYKLSLLQYHKFTIKKIQSSDFDHHRSWTRFLRTAKKFKTLRNCSWSRDKKISENRSNINKKNLPFINFFFKNINI